MTLLPANLLAEAQALVADRLGLDFPRRRHADLERGLLLSARAAGERDPARHVARLAAERADGPGWRRLAGTLTVGETYFFRDRALCDALAREVLPALVASRRERKTRRLRLWSAGCSTGEEPYTLAIMLDRLLPRHERWNVTILGTDVDHGALAAAARGTYSSRSLREAPDAIVAQHFRRTGRDRFELAGEIRSMVAFRQLNLAEDVYPSAGSGTGAMDLIVCRNVLMYLTADAQAATVERLGRALAPGGLLAVGPAEASARLLRPLVPVRLGEALVHRRKDPLAVVAADTGARTSPPARERPPRRLVDRARAEAAAGRLDHAAALYREALVLDRLDADAQLALGLVELERGRPDAAIEALSAAVYLAPGSATAHSMLAAARADLEPA